MKGYAYANDNANAKLVDLLTPKRAESPKLYSPIRKGWGSSLQIIIQYLSPQPKGMCRSFAFALGFAFFPLEGRVFKIVFLDETQKCLY
ncbi:MAG: hypothetical protein Q4A15_12615, partial [Prevotellaceae bacterium]|nr:hypothetical protein [Prevotellaceae bacterium]